MFRLLLKIIPKVIKNSLLGKYKEVVEKDYENHISRLRSKQFNLPRYDLKEKHIKNLKVIENRARLLEFLPKNAVVAELGVDTGDFSSLIIRKTKPQRIHLIDSWDSVRYSSSKKEAVIARFKNEIDDNTLEINEGYSITILEKFDDAYFDWVYIDTDHSYNTTKKELEIAAKKLKKDGIICGHDYYLGNWVGNYKYGVIEAVHEFCVANNWEIIFLTIEQSINPSFAIRKI